MKRTMITSVAIVALAATSAFAGGNYNNGRTTNNYDNSNNASAAANAAAAASASANQSQNQGQAQGQIQGQGQLQGQSQDASNSNAINIEGGVSASIGGATCTNGLSLGVPGTGAIGFSLSDRDCKILTEAQFLHSIGRSDLAMIHIQHIRRFRATMDVVRDAERAAITDQTWDGEKLGEQPTAVSTRTAVAPVARPDVAYASCDFDAAANKVTVQPRRDDLIELATSQCMASLGFVN